MIMSKNELSRTEKMKIEKKKILFHNEKSWRYQMCYDRYDENIT